MPSKSHDQYSPTVKGFIPMIYVAWADGLLSPSEVRIIREQIQSIPQLTPIEKKQLFEWIEPSQWPDQETFKQWMNLMKETGSEIDLDDTISIVDLGLAMAKRSSIGQVAPNLEDLERVLQTLQDELKLPAPAKFRALHASHVEAKTQASGPPSNELQRLLDGDSYDLKMRMRKLLSDPVFEREVMREKDRYRNKVRQWLVLLAEQGFGALGYPEAYGGEGDIIKYAAVFEMLAHFDLSLAVKFGVQFGLFGGSVQHLGTKMHHEKYLADIGKAKLLGCFAMTETGHGSNVRDLETIAIYDADTHMIDVHSPSYAAGKEYIGNALHARMASVFAQLIVQGENQGVHAILVPLRDAQGNVLPGIRIEDNGYKIGLNGVDNGRIWFDHVKVPRENLLNRFGQITLLGRYESEIPNPSKRFFTMLGTLVAGRICVAKGALSAAKSSLAIAIKYALKRRQFGPDDAQEMLIMDYPSHQRRLLPPLARAYAATFALDALVKRYQHRTDADMRLIETQAAGIKAYTTWFANATIQECRECCGGKGYLWENRFADLRSDADIFATFEGDNTVLMQLVAKGLLSSFRQEFNDAGFMGAIRYLASQVSDSFLSLNPIYKRKTDVEHLLDQDFHRHAFQFRQRKLLYSLGSRMRNMFRKRITPYDVFLRTQNHMIEMAQAYVELIILEEFQSKLSALNESPEKELLLPVYQLFALETIETHRAWYLEQDYLEYVKTKAIRHTVDRLCEQIRPHCRPLVDAFGLSNHLLGAEIIEN